MSLSTKIGSQLHAVLAVFILIITTTLCFIPILFIGLCKLIPIKKWQDLCTRAVDYVSILWCGINNLYVDKVQNLKLDITGLENLDRKSWYLVVANHQSWLDIVVLHRLFNRKIPVLKFFIKDQLKWVPLLGFSWWAMGCPFMKRYSKEYLARYPHKKGKDLVSTYKAIEAFKRTPASVMNFIEGTRFTPKKKQQQQSPYNHLLKPKAGGISFIISSMGQQITSLLDVTIVYPEKNHSLWDFLCKKVHSAKISIRKIPIPAQFMSKQLLENSEIHNEFKEWLNEQWAEKDRLIASLK
ncbi:acyltransferase [Legionella sp. km772]|uniref:acyltransferase n=1 Tax=Legionella sp. km772 TaxID=2498111 RepID=UPI000F8E5678|nr:acyltransferase [Legionella sp. km772]RUR13264.1 acyltransferase [Legionella sp. km772]